MGNEDGPKPNHAPAPKMELRPDGNMGRGADEQAFVDRQANMAALLQEPLTPDQQREARMEKFQQAINKDREQAFDGDRFEGRSKGALTQEHSAAKNKDGIER
jgi:hypothetical protein